VNSFEQCFAATFVATLETMAVVTKRPCVEMASQKIERLLDDGLVSDPAAVAILESVLAAAEEPVRDTAG
jgi:hypothetical protein